MHHREKMKSRYVVSHEELVQMGFERIGARVGLLFARQVEEKRKKDETK